MKPALSNRLWLSWRLDNGGRGSVAGSITDGPDKDDTEGTRGKN